MKSINKGPLKKIFNKGSVQLRTKYIDHSNRFLDWVNDQGFEQTAVGRAATFLQLHFDLRRWTLLFLFCLTLSFLLLYEFDFTLSVDVGQVATTDIKSPISFQIVDELATEAKRVEAERATPPVYDYDPNVYEDRVNRLYTAFGHMRELSRKILWPKDEFQREEVIKDFLTHKADFEKDLGVVLPTHVFEWLIENHFGARIENVIRRAMMRWAEYRIVDEDTALISKDNEKIIVREINGSLVGEEFTFGTRNLKSLKKRRPFGLDSVEGMQQLDAKLKVGVSNFAQLLLVPNLSLNKQETMARRQQARESVLPIQIAIQKNQTIVGAGTVVQPVHLSLLNEIRTLQSDRRTDLMVLLVALLLFSFIVVSLSFLRRFSVDLVRLQPKEMVVMGLVTLFMVGLLKAFLFSIDAVVVSKLGFHVPPTLLLYVAPITASIMMITLLVNAGEIIWLYSVFWAVCLSFMVNMNFNFLIFSFIGGLAAARGVYGCRKRNDIYKAGLRTGLVGALVVGCLVTMNHFGSRDLYEYYAWGLPLAVIGGVLASMLVMMFVPILESLFNLTTDIKLLELSNLDHPLIREMMVRAPGTYHHSLAVGAMCEAAANAVGANALLARVMAYYHDIGKMEHAQYFIENQRPGINAHDSISPHLSKTIIIAHVKDGAELGLKHNLGKPIIDGILQHHGTTLISFFYNKAMQQQDEEIHQVGESDFRYPGPKPQFREAAILMLADSIEAAARCLEEPNAARLTSIVKNVVQSKFIDGQLEECDLSLKDLSMIDEAFQKSILSIYHHRIDYPGSAITPARPIIKKLGAKKSSPYSA